MGSKTRFAAIELVHSIIEKIELPVLDLALLYQEGRIGGINGQKSSFFTVPEAYWPYLPSVLWVNTYDETVLSPVIDSEGICFLIVSNGDQNISKHRKNQFEGFQAFTNTVWKQGKTDAFELPVAMKVDYLCFKVIASPIRLWLQNEELPRPFDLDPMFPEAKLWVYHNSTKKFVSSCPISPAVPQYAEFIQLISKLEKPEITNPIVFRSILKSHDIPISKLGTVLNQVQLPVIKQLIVCEMISRSAKWIIRKSCWTHWKDTGDIRIENVDNKSQLIDIASEYFKVPRLELETFYMQPDMYRAKLGDDFLSLENQALFPHHQFCSKKFNYIPTLRLICPRPVPTKPESLSIEYACGVFRLEMAVATGDVIESIVVIGDLVSVILKMLTPQHQLQSRILALSAAARAMVPSCIPVPSNLAHAILQVAPSVLIYQSFREEYSDVTMLCLDNQMAKALFTAGKASEALHLLNSVAERSEKLLGARHSLTVAIWIRKAQAIKKVIETSPNIAREEYLQQGIKCLNKAMRSAELSSESPVVSDLLDPTSFSHHLLSLFHMWNGEPGKAVKISKTGLVRLEEHFGRLHPRYLNSAFLHAKLLEGYCAASMSTASARDAITILENILDTLIELADENGAITADFKEFVIADNGGMLSSETEMRRKLAITSLILKLNVWLLDSRTASDLMDFVVSDKLTGSRGVAILPRRAAVKETVCRLLNEKKSKIEQHFLPILDLSNSLSEAVLACCQLGLDAKSRGTRVSDWFESFYQSTVRTIGGSDFNSPNRDRLVDLFLTFVFINDNGYIFIGPLSDPLVPRLPTKLIEYPSKGVIYREWERSASLYCIDHAFYN